MAMNNEQRQTGLRGYLLPLSIVGCSEDFVCLFTQNQIVEIIEPRFVPEIPGSPGYLKGVLLYRDSLLPVIDLDELCNRGRSLWRKDYRQLVVVRTGAADPETGAPLKAVVATEERMRIAKISGGELAETFEQREIPSALSKTGLLRGCFKHENESVALLDLGPVARGVYAAI
jgi:purine-binding chemotaxis protein CheW